MIDVISAINVQVNQSPKYPPGEHGRCSRERRVLCELCAASYSEVRGRRPEGFISLPLLFVAGVCHAGSCTDCQRDSNTAEQHYVIPNWKCAFSIGLSQYFTFFPAKLKGNSVSTSQMKHCKLTWK